jgi:hypothetical protein
MRRPTVKSSANGLPDHHTHLTRRQGLGGGAMGARATVQRGAALGVRANMHGRGDL